MMIFKKQGNFISLLGMLAISCGGGGGTQLSKSSVKGHFEQYSNTDLVKRKGLQKILPEFAPQQAVVISLEAMSAKGFDQLIPDFFEAGLDQVFIMLPKGDSLTSSELADLAKLAGPANKDKIKPISQKDDGFLTVWARDWSPLTAQTKDPNDNSTKPILLDLNYYPNRTADDSTSRSLAVFNNWPRVSVPVYNEGGNFMTNNQGDCFMTTRVSDANANKARSDDQILNNDQIAEYYTNYGGCSRVTIFQRIPYEGTGHIDMWAKFLDDKTIVVSEVQDDTAQLVQKQKGSGDYQKTLVLQKYLNDRAADFIKLGFTVKRIPLPAPQFGERTYRSYTNSLTLNGYALMPRYIKGAGGWTGYTYTDESLLKSYENTVSKVYGDAGYKVRYIDSDDLIAIGGAIHCITMQIPKI